MYAKVQYPDSCYLFFIRYDLVDLTRQVLAKYANQLFYNIIEAYQSHDVREVTILSQRFLDLVEDLDLLLACHEGFLLGPWLDSAIQLAQNEEQKKQVWFTYIDIKLKIHLILYILLLICSSIHFQFEWNARTQITMWFDNTDEEASLLRDYGMNNS